MIPLIDNNRVLQAKAFKLNTICIPTGPLQFLPDFKKSESTVAKTREPNVDSGPTIQKGDFIESLVKKVCYCFYFIWFDFFISFNFFFMVW
jgi:hypothetical protein